jgi:hypothetical protein
MKRLIGILIWGVILVGSSYKMYHQFQKGDEFRKEMQPQVDKLDKLLHEKPQLFQEEMSFEGKEFEVELEFKTLNVKGEYIHGFAVHATNPDYVFNTFLFIVCQFSFCLFIGKIVED